MNHHWDPLQLGKVKMPRPGSGWGAVAGGRGAATDVCHGRLSPKPRAGGSGPSFPVLAGAGWLAKGGAVKRWGSELCPVAGLASPLSGCQPRGALVCCWLRKGRSFGSAHSPWPEPAGPRRVPCGEGALKHLPGSSGWAGAPSLGRLHPLGTGCSSSVLLTGPRSGWQRRWRMLLPEPGMVLGPRQSRGTFPGAGG